MDKLKQQRQQWIASAQHVNCWLLLAERMLNAGSSPSERALRYSQHYLTGPTAATMLLPRDEFWEVKEALQTFYDEFYKLEMDFNDDTDPAEFTVADYNVVMCSNPTKRVFTDMEFEVIRVMHRNAYVMVRHKCDFPFLHVSKASRITQWLCDNALPQWVVDAESALQDVRRLFEE